MSAGFAARLLHGGSDRSRCKLRWGKSKTNPLYPRLIPQEVDMRTFEDRVFLALVIAVSLAF